MTDTDVFAYGKSGLGGFLFAEIGIEQNGSSLTVLSALARSGEDPWEKAAQWAKAPRTEAVAWLASIIRLSPVAPDAIDAAQDTAARLVQLLPSQVRLAAAAGRATGTSAPGWAGMAMLLAGCVAITLAATVAVSLHPNTPVGQPAVKVPRTMPLTTGQ